MQEVEQRILEDKLVDLVKPLSSETTKEERATNSACEGPNVTCLRRWGPDRVNEKFKHEFRRANCRCGVERTRLLFDEEGYITVIRSSHGHAVGSTDHFRDP